MYLSVFSAVCRCRAAADGARSLKKFVERKGRIRLLLLQGPHFNFSSSLFFLFSPSLLWGYVAPLAWRWFVWLGLTGGASVCADGFLFSFFFLSIFILFFFSFYFFSLCESFLSLFCHPLICNYSSDWGSLYFPSCVLSLFTPIESLLAPASTVSGTAHTSRQRRGRRRRRTQQTHTHKTQ